jgi:hypothetical protein
MVAAAAMQEDDAGTVAIFLVVKTGARQLETRHLALVV